GRVVTREPRTVSCRDPRTGQVSHQWSIAFGGGSWPCLSPDGSTLVAVRHEGREVYLAAWDTGLGEQLWQAEVEPLGAYPLAFARHSPIIAVREPHVIGIWDARGGQKIRQVPFGDRTDEVRFGAFSPDDRIFACIGRNDKSLRLLDLESG